MAATSQACLETCLYSPDLKLLYAYIPKAACTSIKTWLIQEAGFAPEIAVACHAARFANSDAADTSLPEMHRHLDAHYCLRRMDPATAAAILADRSVFKFTFVRHPLPRLVSAYLDKIVTPQRPAFRVIRNWQLRHGCLGVKASIGWLRGQPLLDAERSLSFREFVTQLGRENPERLNQHFRAQTRLLRGVPLDFVGQMEQIASDFAVIQRRLNVSQPLGRRHAQDYRRDVSSECVADWPAARFRGSAAAPDWPRFYDARLLAQVEEMYADDFRQFGYECGLPATSLRRAA